MSEGIVLTSIDSRGIAEVVLNRPERNNAYNGAMIAELINSFTSLYNNNDVKVVLIKGNGKHFQGGADLEWLKEIGKLNKEENIVFTPLKTKNFLKDSFGLSPIFIKELTQENSLNKKEIVLKSKLRSKFYQTAAVWACLIFGASSIYYNVNNDLLEQKLAYEQDLRQESFSKVQKAVFDLGSLPSLTINVKRQASQFYVIAGAFRITKNAENLVSSLKMKGYDSRILPLNEKGLTPVAFEGFSQRKAAVTSLREIQAKENKNAWIFDINSLK